MVAEEMVRSGQILDRSFLWVACWLWRKRRIKNDSKTLGQNNWKNVVDTEMSTLGETGLRVARSREIRVFFGHIKCEMTIRHPDAELK